MFRLHNAPTEIKVRLYRVLLQFNPEWNADLIVSIEKVTSDLNLKMLYKYVRNDSVRDP